MDFGREERPNGALGMLALGEVKERGHAFTVLLYYKQSFRGSKELMGILLSGSMIGL